MVIDGGVPVRASPRLESGAGKLRGGSSVKEVSQVRVEVGKSASGATIPSHEVV